MASKSKLKRYPYDPGWSPKRNEPPAADKSPSHVKKPRRKSFGIRIVTRWRYLEGGEYVRNRWYETEDGRDRAYENLVRKFKQQCDIYPKMVGTRTFEKVERE